MQRPKRSYTMGNIKSSQKLLLDKASKLDVNQFFKTLVKDKLREEKLYTGKYLNIFIPEGNFNQRSINTGN